MNILYKLFTDQKRMKEIRDRTKELQEKMKLYRDDTKKLMETQKEAMSIQMETFKQSMKPTLIIMIPSLLVLSWMAANFAYEPIKPNHEFTTMMQFKNGANGSAEIVVPKGLSITGNAVADVIKDQASWKLQGNEGEYLIQYKYKDAVYDKDVLITKERGYANPVKEVNKDDVKRITVDNEKSILMNIFGWKIGWLGTYIIFSLVFSMILRKAMRLY